MEKNTIVLLSHVTFDNSAYCSYVHDHAKALVKQGYNVIVFAVIRWIPLLSYFQKGKMNFIRQLEDNQTYIDGVQVIYKKALSFSNFLYDSKLNLNGISYYNSIKHVVKKIMKSENVLFVDAHTFKNEGYAAYRIKKKYNVKTLLTLHGTSFRRNYITSNGREQIKRICSTIDYTICVSNKLKNQLSELEVTNSAVIYNGVNQYKDREEQRKDVYQIISVANLKEEKKIDLVIEAVCNLSKEFPELKLNIVGDGVEKGKLTRIINSYATEEKIKLLGRLENETVLNKMLESYIFILTSVNEGFGIVYPEAMSVGCIAIGTKGEGIDGFITNKQNGFLINPEAKEIEDTIRYIYKNQDEVEQIRRKGQLDAKDLTWDTNAEKYINIVKEKE